MTAVDVAPPRILSLFSGTGALDMAVREVLGGHVVAHAEYEPPTEQNPRPRGAAARLLAHRHPGVPNLGDVSAVDWSTVGDVDAITAGFPCQDVSLAGLRLGIAHDTRSGLWAQVAAAIGACRPALVVIENVRGLLSARAHHPAHSHMEPCPWCLARPDDVHLRALGAVLGDLADLGYDAAWCLLSAADVGAPHGRARVFIVARPAVGDPDSVDRDGWTPAEQQGETGPAARRGRPAADPDGGGRHGRAGDLGSAGGWGESADGRRVAADPVGRGRDGGARDAVGGPVTRAVAAGGGAAVGRGPAAHADDRPGQPERARQGPRRGGAGAAAQPAASPRDWGPYAAAIRRWEAVLGRPAPLPTMPGLTADRLSPRFVEWMMGLPAGHVTDVPGLSRADMLKALGNGVVPQQAAAALRLLLPTLDSAAAPTPAGVGAA